MSYQPPQSPFPPPPGSPTGPEGQPTGAPPPSGYPPPQPGPGYPPAGYGAPAPAPARPREPISTRQLASLLLLGGAALLLLATLLNAFLTDFLDFEDRLFLLGNDVVTPLLVVVALLLSERSEGQLLNLIRLGALIVVAVAGLFNLLGLFGGLAAEIDDKFEVFVRHLGVLVVTAGAAWYAFTEFKANRPVRPVAATAPPGYGGYQQPPPVMQPPPGGPPPGPPPTAAPPQGYPPQG